MNEPLAFRMRPTTIDEIVGQQHLLGKNGVIRRCIEQKRLFSMIFYHERPTLQTAVGFVIIFVGIVLNETKPKFALKKN